MWKSNICYNQRYKKWHFYIKNGVTLGNHLSPILFIIFVSNIPQHANVWAKTLSQFADNGGLWSYWSISQYKIKKHLDKIIKWCNIWRIELNLLKTKVLNFSKKIHLVMDCNTNMNNVKLNAVELLSLS